VPGFKRAPRGVLQVPLLAGAVDGQRARSRTQWRAAVRVQARRRDDRRRGQDQPRPHRCRDQDRLLTGGQSRLSIKNPQPLRNPWLNNVS